MSFLFDDFDASKAHRTMSITFKDQGHTMHINNVNVIMKTCSCRHFDRYLHGPFILNFIYHEDHPKRFASHPITDICYDYLFYINQKTRLSFKLIPKH